jgi:hypothetical protein
VWLDVVSQTGEDELRQLMEPAKKLKEIIKAQGMKELYGQ